MTTSPRISFHDGRSIPQLGYGVWQVANEVAADVVVKALEAGYRHVDTARGYNNEAGVGQALQTAGLDRDDVFVTSKVPNQDQGRDATLGPPLRRDDPHGRQAPPLAISAETTAQAGTGGISVTGVAISSTLGPMRRAILASASRSKL